MRNSSTALVISITLVSGCASEHQETAKVDTSASTPLVSLDSLTHKLGTIPEGGIEQIFKFRNQHQQTVRLLPAVTSCACNKVSYSANEIKPGQTVVVTANFNGKAQASPTTTHFLVPWTMGQSSGAVTCVIEATVEKALKVTPSRPEIDSRNGSQVTVMIEQRHGKSRPTSVWSARNEIDCSLSQVDETHWEVKLKWKNRAPDDTRLPPMACDGAMIIVYAEGVGHQQYQIPVRVRHDKEIAVTFTTQGEN